MTLLITEHKVVTISFSSQVSSVVTKFVEGYLTILALKRLLSSLSVEISARFEVLLVASFCR